MAYRVCSTCDKPLFSCQHRATPRDAIRKLQQKAHEFYEAETEREVQKSINQKRYVNNYLNKIKA